MKNNLSALFLTIVVGCTSSPATEEGSVAPQSHPATFSVSDYGSMEGDAALRFIEAPGGDATETVALAALSFSPREAGGARFVNEIRFAEGQFAALARGEAVAPLSEGAFFEGPIGYGVVPDLGADGAEEALTWRNVRSVQLVPTENGRVRATIELGPIVDLATMTETAADPVEAVIEGLLDITCASADGTLDPLFRETEFCSAVWTRTGGFDHLAPSLEARGSVTP